MTTKRSETVETSADVVASNPRYRGAKMSDIARVLLRPANPKARSVLAGLQAGSRKNPSHPV